MICSIREEITVVLCLHEFIKLERGIIDYKIMAVWYGESRAVIDGVVLSPIKEPFQFG